MFCFLGKWHRWSCQGRRSFCAMAAVFGVIFLAANDTAAAEKIRVVTTFTILQDMARNVAGDVAIVESITKPGAEIHGYDPTPLDIVKAQKADLVLWNGLGLERWFERFFGRIKNVPGAVLSDGITPIETGVGKPNPHAWMSPANALVYVENIRVALTEIAPEHAEIFQKNAADYSEKIRALDAPIRERLGAIPEERRWLVTSEGAFAYLAKNYNLREAFLWPVNADTEATPKQVRAVIDTVRANKIPVVFSESTLSNKPILQIANDTGARYGGVLFVDSLTTQEGPAPTYLRLLEVNAQTILRGFLNEK